MAESRANFRGNQDDLALIAHNLRRLMREKGLSLYRLADLMETYPTNIKRIADGESMPGANVIHCMAQVLDLRMEEFFRPLPAGAVAKKPVPRPKRTRRASR